jgi:hypothetical protein
MEARPYFILGDILACAVTGAAAGWLVHAMLPGDFLALAGMALGMVLGMLVGFVGGVLFTPLFGSMEISLPAGLAGMVAGGGVGMLQYLTEMDSLQALWGGALGGLACLAYTYILQAFLRGKAA